MQPSDGESLLLSLDGFEGPLDMLLELARAQKVDLARISIVALVDQYLAIVEGARRIRLELAADWLVMAAWLAWLKSRLLLPSQSEGAEEGEQAADVLAARLRELETMRAAGAWLSARPQLRHDIFARGAAEDLTRHRPLCPGRRHARVAARLSRFHPPRRRPAQLPPAPVEPEFLDRAGRHKNA